MMCSEGGRGGHPPRGARTRVGSQPRTDQPGFGPSWATGETDSLIQAGQRTARERLAQQTSCAPGLLLLEASRWTRSWTMAFDPMADLSTRIRAFDRRRLGYQADVDDPARASGGRVSTVPLRAGLAHSDLDIDQLWWRYISLGGSMRLDDMVTALHEADLSRWEYDHLAHALNEGFVDQGGDHPVAYSNELEEGPTVGADDDRRG
jgi:hypothetical protein